MTSLRESPIRRQPANRPPWLIPVLVVVAVLVVVGLMYALVSLFRSSGSSSATAGGDGTPQVCVTQTVTPAEVLPKPAKVTVNVYNASDVSGLASKTANELRGRGFKIAKIANDPAGKAVTGVGEIRYGPKAAKRAQLLALYVPGARLVALDRKGLRVDLATGDAFTGVAAQADVDAALASPSPVATGPGCASATSG